MHQVGNQYIDCPHVLSRVQFVAKDMRMCRHRQSLVFNTSFIRLSLQKITHLPPPKLKIYEM